MFFTNFLHNLTQWSNNSRGMPKKWELWVTHFKLGKKQVENGELKKGGWDSKKDFF